MDTNYNSANRVFVIESAYRRHRENLLNIKSTLPTKSDHERLHAVNRRKQIDAEFKRSQLAHSNESMGNRLRQIEQGESNYAKEKREHLKKIIPVAQHRRHVSKLTTDSRRINVHNENMFIFQRLSKVTSQPDHVSQSCAEWYDYHEKYLRGRGASRKQRVTGGYLMKTIPRDLRPTTMQDFEKSVTRHSGGGGGATCSHTHLYNDTGLGSDDDGDDDEDNWISALDEQLSMQSTLHSPPSAAGVGTRSLLGRGLTRSGHGSSLLQSYSSPMSSSFSHRPNTRSVFGERPGLESVRDIVLRRVEERKPFSFEVDRGRVEVASKMKEAAAVAATEQLYSPIALPPLLRRRSSLGHLISQSSFRTAERGATPLSATSVPMPTRRKSVVKFQSAGRVVGAVKMEAKHGLLDNIVDENPRKSTVTLTVPEQQQFRSDLRSILSWNFPMPNQPRNCQVEVSVLRDQTDNRFCEELYIRMLSTSTPHFIMAERALSVDEANEVANLVKYLPQAVDDSAANIQAILHNMFFEHDTDGNGTLSYPELQQMMRKLGLGISSEDLQKIIAEADADENGKVDYSEFVHIAASMLQTFRAKSLANVCHNEKAIDELVQSSINKADVDRIAAECLSILTLSDASRSGSLPAHLIKRRLLRFTHIGITANEVTMLCQSLPHNYNGQCMYENIRHVLYDVRFACMKAAVLQSQTNNFASELNDRFRSGISALKELFPDSHMIRNGNLPIRNVVDILLDLPTIPLSRIQVIMIINEANVIDDTINVWQFIPVASKFIEQMFDPKVLQAKVSAMNAEMPLLNEDSEALHRRLMLLFKAYDLDLNGVLNYDELTQCVNSLELDLNPNEVKALVACAFPDSSDENLTFEQFCIFFIKSVLALLQDKRVAEFHPAGPMHQRGHKHQTDGNEKFLYSLYAHIADAKAEVDGSLMRKSLMLIVPPASACYQLLVAVADPTLGFVPIDDIVRDQARLLRLFGYSTHKQQQVGAGSEQNSPNLTGRRSTFAAPTAASSSSTTATMMQHNPEVLDEQNVRLQAEAAAVSCDWLLDWSADFMLRELGVAVGETAITAGWQFHTHAQTFWQALLSPHSLLTHIEAHFVFGQLKARAAASVTDWVTRGDLRASLCEAKVLLLIWDAVDDEPSDKLYERMYEGFSAVHQQLPFDSFDTDAPSYVTTEDCLRTMGAASFLRLNRLDIFFLMYWSDAFEKNGNIVKYKRFAQYAADSIVSGLRKLEFRATFYRMMSAAISEVGNSSSSCMHVEPNDLSHFLDIEFNRADHDGTGLISRDNAEKVLRHIPRVRLTKDEVYIIAGTFCTDKMGTFEWEHFIPHSYITTVLVLLVRYIGRRLTMIYSDFDRDSMQYITTLPFKKLAERILHVVAVTETEGVFSLSFPDPTIYLPPSEYEDEKKESVASILDKAFSLHTQLRVLGHPLISALQLRLEFKVETSMWKSKVYAMASVSDLELPTQLSVDFVPPSPLMVPLPSTVAVDDEEAMTYLTGLAENMYITCDGEHSSILSIREMHAGKHDAQSH